MQISITKSRLLALMTFYHPGKFESTPRLKPTLRDLVYKPSYGTTKKIIIKKTKINDLKRKKNKRN